MVTQTSKKPRRVVSIFLMLTLCFFQSTALAINWPQELTTPSGQIIIYQPQPEKLEGNKLYARSAISMVKSNSDTPIFGVFWFTAQIDTDNDTGKALIHSFQIERVRWPESNKSEEKRFIAVIEDFVPKSGFEISMTRLSASLANAEIQMQSLKDIKNEPPVMVFKDKASVLLTYDGKPRFSSIEGENYERAVNTAYMVASNKTGSAFYLSNGLLWYSSSSALGPWVETIDPPADLVKLLAISSNDIKSTKSQVAPEIVVATIPTELIVSSGKPLWASLAGGKLLYVKNTQTPWLRELTTNRYYILLSGRWFSSKNTKGPWLFVHADELPESFSEIPSGSDIGGIRTSIAGTPEAEEALLDYQIPQTSAIKRSDAKLEVKYNGQPDFILIANTKVHYAINTASQVLWINHHYYAVDNGVWFVSDSATGPWKVADKIPTEQIAEIPPSSPVYNTTYVHVYHSTPELVYVGYTPGYMWSFPYYGVPVYGSGWYYPPYYGQIYYPRPVTWGFHVGYNPYTGWNYGVSVSNGFLSIGIGWNSGHGGGYGCCYGGHHGPIIINPGTTIINNGNINIGNNINAGNRDKIVQKLANNPKFDSSKLQNSNLYKRVGNNNRNARSALARQDFSKAIAAKGIKNNVFADRDGKLVRRNNEQWQSRQNGQWRNDQSLNKRPSTDSLQKSLNKSRNSRATKNYTGNYNRQLNLNNAYSARQIGAIGERTGRRSKIGRRK